MLAGSGLYYYVVDEYKVSNELLTEDVYVSSSLSLGESMTVYHLSGLQQTDARFATSGTSISSAKARGLRQGPGAGRQVEEMNKVEQTAGYLLFCL